MGSLGRKVVLPWNLQEIQSHYLLDTYQALELDAEETTESKTHRVSAPTEFKSW